MREILISKLFQELLGPRNGISEEFNSNESPSLEFITGILSPVETSDETWVDTQTSSSQFPSISHQRMEGDEQEEQESASLNPSLNPQKPPSTMGLSFQAATVPSPEFKIKVNKKEIIERDYAQKKESEFSQPSSILVN